MSSSPTTPEKAKALLAEAGVEGNYPLTNVYYEPDPLAVDAQKALETGMKDAGFDLTGIPVEVSPYDIWLNPDDKTEQEAQPPRCQLVLGLAVGSDHDPAAAEDRWSPTTPPSSPSRRSTRR